MRKHWAALAVIAIGALVACDESGDGGGGDAQVASLDDSVPDATTDDSAAGAATAAPTDPEEAMLAFTECMREHGVDMPDPQVAEPASGGAPGRGAVIAVNGDPDDPTFQEAEEACEPLIANVRGELDDDPARLAEMKQQMLDFAQCMRDHGIDMPDPTFDADGRVKFDTGPGGIGAERDTDAFNEAAEACNEGGEGPMIQMSPGGASTFSSESAGG